MTIEHVVLLLAGITALGLLAFSLRRFVEKRRGSAPPLATEQYVCTPVFQDRLSRLVSRQQSDEALKQSRKPQ
jgi:hypothetical protein